MKMLSYNLSGRKNLGRPICCKLKGEDNIEMFQKLVKLQIGSTFVHYLAINPLDGYFTSKIVNCIQSSKLIELTSEIDIQAYYVINFY